jgi:hypothetical protein
MLFTIGSMVTTSYASPEHKYAEKTGGHAGGHMDRMNDILRIDLNRGTMQKFQFTLNREL